MKILMVGTDRRAFENGSDVEGRLKGYASLFDELHIIIFTRRGFTERTPSSALRLYPTNSWNRFLYILNAYRLGRRLQDIDIVSAQDPFECGIAAWLIARRLKAKLQFQVHTDFLSPYFSQESFVNKIRVRVAKFLLSRANGIRVVSERIKNSIIVNCKLKIDNSKIMVLPIFVDAARNIDAKIKIDLHKKYSFASPIILMASRFTREKNILMGARAMQEVVKRYPKALLLLVGDGPERRGIELEIENRKLQNYIKLEPWADDLGPYYSVADVFVLTSNYEGYGRTAIEAAIHKVPVVMTDVGIGVGSVVPVGDADTLAARILEVLEGGEERERILRRQELFLSSLPSRAEYKELFKDQFTAYL